MATGKIIHFFKKEKEKFFFFPPYHLSQYFVPFLKQVKSPSSETETLKAPSLQDTEAASPSTRSFAHAPPVPESLRVKGGGLSTAPAPPAPPDSQVGQAGLAHSRGYGFDGRQHGVQQLCELPSPFGLSPLFHNVASQGEHVRFKGASVRHRGGELCKSFFFPGSPVYLKGCSSVGIRPGSCEPCQGL